MNVKLYTLGCKVNQYETEEIAQALLREGFSPRATAKRASLFESSSAISPEAP